MAFDQSTRNRLQKFVSSARAILSEEFTRQLQATYGLDPKLGTNAPIKSLTHLDNRQRQTAHLLRETLAHYLASTAGKTEKDRIKQVLDRIVREQAFTVLNRLAALRMAEARGFLIESISKAYSSQGFQLFRHLSGSAHGETGDAYRNYLFSLFDEFSLDLAVLFDRHSAQGRLFPRESALLALLGEINHADIEHLWAEDETIGWIYQYFNSQEERKKMRAESQAPRNSRELAVRNQFFTPRYVVEFLTDNTLGRIWYEMTQGNTGLVDSCRYLVLRPTEIFLKPGESAPETEQNDEALSQQELLQQPVYIPHRPLKDPRTIRMLDPACGSMHFGLYAFDLFERIYLEAWQLEQQLGAGAFTREHGLASLQETYVSLDDYKQQIPKLIIEHNIHGVDIDPRAVQIAGLSLWQRAQRAWHQQGIKPQQRPTIVKSNIVCAEPMPGEKALLQEFTSKLNPPVFGQLLEVIFDKMQLAGEAGTLLKIEEEIQTAIHEAREQWLKQSGSRGTSDLFQAELDAAIPQTKLGFDLRGINDESFWNDAELRILQALSDYAEQAEATADQKRLFAEDAAKGFAFIDLCRKRFDVVLMNPPFGEFSDKHKTIAEKSFSSGSHEISSSFVERCLNLQAHSGRLGCISSRAIFFGVTTKNWREHILRESSMVLWVELGAGVLDGAMVETSMYVIENSQNIEESLFSKHLSYLPGMGAQLPTQDLYLIDARSFLTLSASPFSYWLDKKLFKAIKSNPPLSECGVDVKVGLQTGDDFRFVRSWFEVGLNPGWVAYSKGGDNSPFCVDIHLVVNWKNVGREISSHPSSVTRNSSYYGREGFTFSYRTSRFSPGLMPKNTIPGVAGMGIYLNDESSFYVLLGLLNSSVVNELISTRLGRVDSASLYQAGVISPTPLPNITVAAGETIACISKELIEHVKWCFSFSECSRYFSVFLKKGKSVQQQLIDLSKEFDNKVESMLDGYTEIDNIACEIYSFPRDDLGKWKDRYASVVKNTLLAYIPTVDDFVSFLIGKAFGRWVDCEASNLDLMDCPQVPTILAIESASNQSLNIGVLSLTELTEMILKEARDYDFVEPVEALNQLGIVDLNSYLGLTSQFFSHHLKKYTLSKRASPIYWPLQTLTGSYTLWVYYHRLNEQTLYTCVNDFVEPKLEQVEQDLNGLRNKSARSSQEEKELEKLSDLAIELRDFRDELLRIAKFWKPNLNDGVQITAAPLWKLFQHKAWQKKLKETWESLEQGEYDWAHLACSIWPDRVLRKCHQDRSLAIAHDVEDHFWHEVEVPVTRGKKATGETKLEWQPKDLTEPEILILIKRIKEEKGL